MTFTKLLLLCYPSFTVFANLAYRPVSNCLDRMLVPFLFRSLKSHFTARCYLSFTTHWVDRKLPISVFMHKKQNLNPSLPHHHFLYVITVVFLFVCYLLLPPLHSSFHWALKDRQPTCDLDTQCVCDITLPSDDQVPAHTHTPNIFNRVATLYLLMQTPDGMLTVFIQSPTYARPSFCSPYQIDPFASSSIFHWVLANHLLPTWKQEGT